MPEKKSKEQNLPYYSLLHRKRFLFSLSVIFTFVFLVIFLQVCQKKKVEDNFILITLDTQRADFISAYSPDNVSTPHIDFLAKQGILYENCFSLIPITLPSHASIFFSEPPHLIKNYNNGQIIGKKRKSPSFVNIFKKKGYITAAFVSLGVLKSQFGLNDGFYYYKDEFPKGRWYLTAKEINQNVFPWLEENKEQKLFLWIHYSDPHDPYAPPNLPPDLKLFLNGELLGEYCLNKYSSNEVYLDLKKGGNQIRFEVKNDFVENENRFHARFDTLDFSLPPEEKEIDIRFSLGWHIQEEQNLFFSKKSSTIDILNHSQPRQIKLTFLGRLLLPVDAVRELYKKEVEYMDGEIGKLWNKLKELKLFKKTHILMVGDHGEGLGEYLYNKGSRHIGHIHFLYNIYMKVPLIIYDPHASAKGVRIETPVTLLDIAPTIMKIMGQKRLSHFQGRNLLRLEEGKNFSIFEETYKPEAVKDRFAILQFPWHLIFIPEEKKYELFDLKVDPEEKKNIFEERDFPQEVLKLKKKLDSFSREVLKGKEEIKIDDKTKEMLRALGYIK